MEGSMLGLYYRANFYSFCTGHLVPYEAEKLLCGTLVRPAALMGWTWYWVLKLKPCAASLEGPVFDCTSSCWLLWHTPKM